MIRPPSDKLAKNALLVVAIAGATLAMAAARPVAVDLAVSRTGSHALVQIGFASFRLAFDSGQKCPNPNSCTAPLL